MKQCVTSLFPAYLMSFRTYSDKLLMPQLFVVSILISTKIYLALQIMSCMNQYAVEYDHKDFGLWIYRTVQKWKKKMLKCFGSWPSFRNFAWNFFFNTGCWRNSKILVVIIVVHLRHQPTETVKSVSSEWKRNHWMSLEHGSLSVWFSYSYLCTCKPDSFVGNFRLLKRRGSVLLLPGIRKSLW